MLGRQRREWSIQLPGGRRTTITRSIRVTSWSSICRPARSTWGWASRPTSRSGALSPSPANLRRSALLLTGPPGVGKTTVLRRVAKELSELEIRGFVTEEIREAGLRVGFRIETPDGQSDVLAHVKIRSPDKVSRYGVDLAVLDRVVAGQFSGRRTDVVLIDEIGKMECLSSRFVETVESLLDSATVCVATVALRGEGFIEAIKRRPGVLLWRVGRANRDAMPEEVAHWVRSTLHPQP